MLSIAHTLIGLPLAFYLDSPGLIFLAAFFGHFVCDSLLHWNIYPDKWGHSFLFLAAADVVVGLVAAWLLVGEWFFTLPVLAAVVGSNAPDILHQIWNLLGAHWQRRLAWAQPAAAWHEHVQVETNRWTHGLVAQGSLILIAALLVRLRLYP